MEFRQLQYFVVLAELLNFTRAADVLHITQPTLSQQISALERELGCSLLCRANRQISLTENGKVFLEEARYICARAGNLERMMKTDGGGGPQDIRELRVAIQPCFMDFPHAFRALIAAANVMTREHATNLRFTADTLDHADIDAFDAFIFIRNEILDQSLHDLNCWKLERDKLVLAIRQPSTDKQISPRQFLYSRPLIAVKNGLHSKMPLVQTAEQVGVESNISLADDSATAVLQVCSGLSGLIVPSKAANHIFKGVSVQYFDLPQSVDHQICIECGWTKENNEDMRRFSYCYDEAYISLSVPDAVSTLPFF